MDKVLKGSHRIPTGERVILLQLGLIILPAATTGGLSSEEHCEREM